MRLLSASVKIVAILLVAGVWACPSAVAADTQITAMVCSPSVGASITLYQPATDTVVNSSSINLVARVAQSKSVAVNVDGIQRLVLDLQTLNETINVSVAVTQGTHEIKLVSQDMCGVQNGVATAVVTYSPGPLTSSLQTVAGGNVGGFGGWQTLALSEKPSFGDELIRGVLDSARPASTVDTSSALIALPFVVGTGAFGWVHIRNIGR